MRAFLGEATVAGVNSAYESALRESDTDALQRLIAPDFLFITSTGEARDRQELLRFYGAKEVNLRVFKSNNVRVRFYESVGIFTADITKEGDYVSGPRAGAIFTGRYRFTRVYACGAQGWQLVHSSRPCFASRLHPAVMRTDIAAIHPSDGRIAIDFKRGIVS